MDSRRLPLLLISILLLVASSCTAQMPAPRFQCSSTSKCQALLGYVADNETSYEAIMSIFQVHSIRALFGANDVNPSTSAAEKVSAGETVKVPFPCACANGSGVADGRPVYTVKKGDTMSDIATKIYKSFVTYQQIGDASKVTNYSLIEVGQKLHIPLPCSCDPVDGQETVHLAHSVAKGSTLSSIAADFGTTEQTLSQINGISDPKKLMEGQILDVPLRACNSSIRSDAKDHSLRVPNGSYALTADNCVKCSCSSASWQLACEMVQDLKLNNSSTRCRAPEPCSGGTVTGQLQFGREVPNPNGCGSIRCDYAGFNGSAILTVAATNQSTCGAGGGGQGTTPASGARAWGPSSWAPLRTALLLFVLL